MLLPPIISYFYFLRNYRFHDSILGHPLTPPVEGLSADFLVGYGRDWVPVGHHATRKSLASRNETFVVCHMLFYQVCHTLMKWHNEGASLSMAESQGNGDWPQRSIYYSWLGSSVIATTRCHPKRAAQPTQTSNKIPSEPVRLFRASALTLAE